ncbi:Asp23/Gls24 family envelope stress response protein [Cryobacterium sp. TMT1-66-1]|uniref:Asp23/Gls24 family envelope stress response protein n=1 Tax=Cryobacterium sp. TMT1-66-1 TaxID=1259242 RepID=UPI0010698576|nr:Asp23/Gls24 family envelope stress response protein [Cryobacterium sp. TMT1-66-1]TFD05899.1 Asp23/Gls24 family envelope stress response protein [Cryobacterium sp. TMT1-66-1]
MTELTPANRRFLAFDLDDTEREQAGLNGHTIEQLSDYLDRDRTPADPSIDDSPECEIALRGLERLRRAQRLLLKLDLERESRRDDSWVSAILDNITLEAHAGRDIPLTHPVPTARLVVTEGAVRGILRESGDRMQNVFVGRCVLVGDVNVPGTPIVIEVDVTVFPGEKIPLLADQLRHAMYAALGKYTELVVAAIDITVSDLQALPDASAQEKEH